MPLLYHDRKGVLRYLESSLVPIEPFKRAGDIAAVKIFPGLSAPKQHKF